MFTLLQSHRLHTGESTGLNGPVRIETPVGLRATAYDGDKAPALTGR